MFGITLNSYLSSMLGHKFHEDVMVQTQIIYCEFEYNLYNGKNKVSMK